jgi:hypothetical protein
MSKFKKGQSGNPKGRPKGAKNILSKDLRETITDFLNENIETVTSKFSEMNTRDQSKLIIDLLQYAIPKLQNAKHEMEHFIRNPMIEAALRSIKGTNE